MANEGLLGSFPDASIPWKATFMANEGLLHVGTYMVPWKASFVANEGLLGLTWFPVESIPWKATLEVDVGTILIRGFTEVDNIITYYSAVIISPYY